MSIRKAVFPVAGLGTRFLPATKANPKEMLPIVDKPLIQYAVEEAIAAGIREIIFVTSSAKRAIEDHFDSNFELETTLEARGQHELLRMVKNILPAGVSCSYVRQTQPLGLGHAVLCAKPLVGNEPFAVLLADDLIDAPSPGCLSQMVQAYQASRQSLVAVQTVAPEDVHKYGIVAMNEARKVVAIVEKPRLENAPSRWGVVGRYILNPTIFKHLENLSTHVGQEIQLTDGIAKLIHEDGVQAHGFEGRRYDCGSKLGYLEATVAYALKHPEIRDLFKVMMHDFMEEHPL